jgi:hypothetical protein
MANAGGRPTSPLVLEPEAREYLERQVRRRFLSDRVEGLLDEARPGRPRTIDDDQVAAVIERTLHSTPVDATHWSIRSMAGATGFSHTTTIRRIWTAFGLQPHRSEPFKLSSDPLFVDKVRDIVGLYLAPPNRALVLSVDEKSQIQALDREQPVRPMMPSMPERRTHSYVRHGIVVRRARHRVGFRDRQMLRATRPRCPHHHGQLRDLQNCARPGMARSPAALPCPLHTHLGIVDQPDRALVRRADPQATAPPRPHLTSQLERDIHAFIDQHNKKPETLPMDQVRR